jgi:hypothetical protein
MAMAMWEHSATATAGVRPTMRPLPPLTLQASRQRTRTRADDPSTLAETRSSVQSSEKHKRDTAVIAVSVYWAMAQLCILLTEHGREILKFGDRFEHQHRDRPFGLFNRPVAVGGIWKNGI